MRKYIELHRWSRGKGRAKKDVRDYRQDMFVYIFQDWEYNSHEQRFDLQDKPKPKKNRDYGSKIQDSFTKKGQTSGP